MSSQSRSRRDILIGVVTVESISLLIGLAMPITPSKTGSDGSLADLFFQDPSYLQEVLVYFVLGNVIIGAMILAAWIWERISRARKSEPDEPPEPKL